MVQSIAESSLGRLEDLAEGTFGQVFRVCDPLPAVCPGPVAFKKFTCDFLAQARSAEAVVKFRDSLSTVDRDELDAIAAWPVSVVVDFNGGICGILMPLLGPEYFCDQIDPKTGQKVSLPREMSWLITTRDQRIAAQVDLPDIDLTERLLLLARLVYAVGRLHRHGWVFGDLSFKNVAFSLSPLRLKLLDCDGTAEISNLNRSQSSTPFWDPPECPIGVHNTQLQDPITDVYKAGLAVLRCLTPGKGAASSRSVKRMVDELNPAGRALLERALGADRNARPSAKELYEHLRDAVAPRVSVPVVTKATLDSHLVIRGMDARVSWGIVGASTATITAGNGVTIDVDLKDHQTGFTFRPAASGPVTIEVHNKYGSITAACGDLLLYEVPVVDLPAGLVPRIVIDSLAAPQLPQVLASVDMRPRVGVGTSILPASVSPPAYDFLANLAPPLALPADPLPTVSSPVAAASDQVMTAVTSEIQQFIGMFRGSLAQAAAIARSGL